MKPVDMHDPEVQGALAAMEEDRSIPARPPALPLESWLRRVLPSSGPVALGDIVGPSGWDAGAVVPVLEYLARRGHVTRRGDVWAWVAS